MRRRQPPWPSGPPSRRRAPQRLRLGFCFLLLGQTRLSSLPCLRPLSSAPLTSIGIPIESELPKAAAWATALTPSALRSTTLSPAVLGSAPTRSASRAAREAPIAARAPWAARPKASASRRLIGLIR